MKNKLNITILAPFSPYTGGMVSLATSLAERFEKDGNLIFRLQAGTGLSNFYLLPSLYIKMIYYTFRSDVVHIISASGKALYGKVLPLIVIGIIFRKKVILNFVGGKAIDKSENWRWYRKLPFLLATKVVLPTNQFKRLLTMKISRINFYVIPHIVDVDLFINNDLTIVSDQPILIAAKEMKKYAGHFHLLRIFREIQDIFPNAELWFTSDGPERKNDLG